MKSSSKSVCTVILGAGKGARANLGYNKVLFNQNGSPIIKATADKFSFCDKIIVVCPPDELDTFNDIFCDNQKVTVITGGSTRTESVRRALPLLDCDVTLIHDGARPYASENLIRRVIDDVLEFDSAVPCTPASVAIKAIDNGKARSVDRNGIYFVQTPQGFDTNKLIHAYEQIKGDYSDDSEVFEKAGFDVHITEGETANVKLTNPEDFLGGMKIGSGFDVHQLVENRKLILGGVEIPFNKGLLGHSDADVLTHAIMDALLSANGLPDIGVLFPDNDPSTENVSSMLLLSEVMQKISDCKIVNVSAVIMAQKPKLAPFIPEIRRKLASALNVAVDNVNVSATTTEHLGIIGEGKGIAASATVLIRK